MTAKQPDRGDEAGKHDSGKTSKSPQSGKGGRHSQQPNGYPLGTRRDRPHHKDGWGSDR